MGVSSSTEQQASPEQREVESIAASTGALPMLRRSFSKLSDSQTNAVPLQSLKECFSLNYKPPCRESLPVAENFSTLLQRLGSSIVDLFFVPGKEDLNWVEFVRGYVRSSGRMSASMSYNTLLRLYAHTLKESGGCTRLGFESDEADCKINGSLMPVDISMLLWMCWIMFLDSKSKSLEGSKDLILPDLSHLVLSAVVSCAEAGSNINVWDCEVSGLEAELPVGKFLSWALTTVPILSECLAQFVSARLQKVSIVGDELNISNSTAGELSLVKTSGGGHLTCGVSWAISLTSRGSINEEILKACFPCNEDESNENCLYRSSLHGKGLNRFWANIDGYHGPMLMLISASCGIANDCSSIERKWVIGILTDQGFENREIFYGSSGSLYAISPLFLSFSASGKEKNFVYSHQHPAGRVYEANPKPVGIGFGGTLGNERVFIDEDFARIIIRHHAVDKTYQPGSLIPNQGFLPVEASVLEVEVWGLGGKTARDVQSSHKKREELFTEQRRKVDLKTFGNWEDSPEKMMMDMVSDPNRVQREDR